MNPLFWFLVAAGGIALLVGWNKFRQMDPTAGGLRVRRQQLEKPSLTIKGLQASLMEFYGLVRLRRLPPEMAGASAKMVFKFLLTVPYDAGCKSSLVVMAAEAGRMNCWPPAIPHSSPRYEAYRRDILQLVQWCKHHGIPTGTQEFMPRMF